MTMPPPPHSAPPSSDAAPQPPARRWSDADVVVDRALLVHPLSPAPSFGEDKWDLSCISQRPNHSPFTLLFGDLPLKWQRAAKEIVAQRLNEPVVSIRRTKWPRPLQPESARKLLDQMAVVFAFLDRHGVDALPEVEPKHLLAFLGEINELSTSSRWKAALLKVFDVFYESRDYLSSGGLAFHPFPEVSLLAIAGVEPQEENLTERIPEDVLAHVLFWALAYIDHFSKDILAAEALKLKVAPQDLLDEAELRAGEMARAGRPASATRPLKISVTLRWQARLEAYLRRRGPALGIPARITKGEIVPAADLIANGAGVPLSYVTEHGTGLKRLRASALPMRLDCLGDLQARLPGGKAAWRAPLTMFECNRECRRLQVAAYIVIAYLSGMRDSEVQTLKRGCISVLRDERGEIYRHKLTGLTYKGQGGRPRERQWVVIEPVARAVGILEALTERLHRSKRESYLFASLRHRDDSMGLFQSTINAAMCEFAAHCETEISPRQAGADLPASPKTRAEGAWRFKPTQFRRTLAWHIANQPFGVIAGMIQYGHTSIQMFEGYAGTSDSGFAAEVERDRFLARLEDVVEMFEDDSKGLRPAGPIAQELTAFFERKRQEIGAFPGEVADPKRIRELLKQKAADLHVGPLVHCFYSPAQARCRPNNEAAEAAGPLIGLCDPDCSNACWAQKTLPNWERLHGEVTSMLKVNSIPHRQQQILRRQRDTAKRAICAIHAARKGGEVLHG